MRTTLSLIFLFLSFSLAVLSQEIIVATPREIYTDNELAYLNSTGQPFTGILMDAKETKKMGEYKNGKKEGLFLEVYESGNKKTEGKFLHGMKNGLFTEYYENGDKKNEGVFDQGLKEGTHMSYYENGSKASIGKYSGDLINLTFTEFYNNGNKKNEGEFKNGYKNGIYAEYYENGIKKNEGAFINGYKNGLYAEYYESGNKKNEVSYTATNENAANAQEFKNGFYKEYYENGAIKSEINYENGKKEGKYSEWYKNSKIKKELPYSQNLVADGTANEYDSLGEKTKVVEYKNGAIISEFYSKDGKYITYFNGVKGSEGYMKNNIKEGYWIEYYQKDGGITFEGYYVNGKREGKGKEYNSNGKIHWDGEYKDGAISGFGTMTESDGSIYKGVFISGLKQGSFSILYTFNEKAEGNFLNNKKNGLWTEWYSTGIKKSEIQYVNGETLTGSFRLWYPNGKSNEFKKYFFGKLDSTYIKWFDNGVKEIELSYSNGEIMDGTYYYNNRSGDAILEENYRNGKIISKYKLHDGQKNGYFSINYFNGNPKMVGIYTNGKRKVTERYGSNDQWNKIGKTFLYITLLSILGVLGALTSQ